MTLTYLSLPLIGRAAVKELCHEALQRTQRGLFRRLETLEKNKRESAVYNFKTIYMHAPP